MRTLTNLETPSSCIVIPYKVSAYSIVLFLWVIIINCDLYFRVYRYFPKTSTLASSRAASTSSKITNGTVLTFRIANNHDIAVPVLSPPENRVIELNFFPGG